MARPDQWLECYQLLVADRKTFGFVRKVVIEQACAKHQMLIACDETGRIVACARIYLRRDGFTTLHEIVVAKTLRRQGYASQLVHGIRDWCIDRRSHTIRAVCPIDEDSNTFYRKTGWSLEFVKKGTKRDLNVWERPTGRQFRWMSSMMVPDPEFSLLYEKDRL